MGKLRVILAISVVIAHTEPCLGLYFMGGEIAVQAFYIVSGFYMSLVLNTKYLKKKNSYRLFITNRLLRLYPIYFAVLVATVGLSLVSVLFTENAFKLSPYIVHYDQLNFSSLAFLILTNITILGQDLATFIGFAADGSLTYMENFRASDPMVLSFLFVPQAWTISLEIMFYLIAPFLAKRTSSFLGILCIISLISRLYCYQLGYNYDPWTYRFFPFELIFFLVGMLAYRIYSQIDFQAIHPNIIKGAYYFILLFTLGYQFVPFESIKSWIYIGFIAVLLPFIFQYSRHDKADRAFGEYSYPIYIVHLLVVSLVLIITNALNIPREFTSEITIIGCFIASKILIVFISDPIEKVRLSVVSRGKLATAA